MKFTLDGKEIVTIEFYAYRFNFDRLIGDSLIALDVIFKGAHFDDPDKKETIRNVLFTPKEKDPVTWKDYLDADISVYDQEEFERKVDECQRPKFLQRCMTFYTTMVRLDLEDILYRKIVEDYDSDKDDSDYTNQPLDDELPF